MGSSLRRSHRAWLLKVFCVLVLGFSAVLVTAGVVGAEPVELGENPALSIGSDKDDYAPGELVRLSSFGWQPGEAVHVFVNDEEGRSWNHDADVTAGEDGIFEYEVQLPSHFVATYKVTATGDTSGYTTVQFADSIAAVSSLTANNTGGSTLSINAPVTPIGGVIVAQIVATDSVATTRICPSALQPGWQTQTTTPNNLLIRDSQNKVIQQVFWRVATAANAAVVSYTWQFRSGNCPSSGSAQNLAASGGIASYTGVDTTTPIDAAAGTPSSSSGGTATAPAVTTTGPGAFVLRYFGVFKNTTINPLTVPPKIYEAKSSSSKERAAAAYGAAQAGAGDTGTFAATFSSAEWVAQTVALKAAATNAAPATPADLGQFRSNGTTAISLGGYTNETSVVLKGSLDDPDLSDSVRLQVEVKPVGTAFDGTTGLVTGSPVTDPATASATVSGLVHSTGYHWRARGLDDDNAASAWQSFGGGNPETAADFTVDTVKPTLTASATSPPAGPAYNAGTWTNQNVRVAFACADPLSGVATDTVPDVTVSTDGEDQSVTSSGACVDAAGNAADAATFANIDLDKTAPEVATTLDWGPDHNGWYNAPVDWTTNGTDDTSGIATCSTGTYNGLDGTGLTVSGSCTDLAGNSASDSSPAFDYDDTNPTATTTLLRPPDHNGWYNHALEWETTGTDETSGLAVGPCDSGTYDGPDGEALTVTGSCTDVAGNSASDTSDAFDYDATAPEVTTTLDDGPDSNGWYNNPVDWTAHGSADLSGIDNCDTGTYSGPDGEDLTVTGSCTDVAGNSASDTSDAFDYDATAPEVTTTLDDGPDSNGWYNNPVDWTAHGSADLSGIDNCDTGTYSGPDGEDLTVTGSCTDVAGNSASDTSDAFDYDATAPEVTTTLDDGPDSNGWYNNPVDWTAHGSADLSGIDNCDTGTYSGPDGEDLTVTGSCTDVAGNSASDTSDAFDYDATAPEVTTTLDDGPDSNGWYNNPVDWTAHGSADLSGIDNCDTGTYSGPDGEDLTVTGSCTDVAGNSASDTSDAFDYDATAPEVTTTLDDGPDSNGWYNNPVDWTAHGSADLSGIDNCDTGTYSGPDGEDLTVTGSCTDVAGNSASDTSDAFDYDATAPEVTTTLDDGPDSNGWYNNPVDWTAHGSADLSGIDNCDTGTYSGPDGEDLTVTGSCTDVAGNSASDTSDAFDYDNTDPQLTPTVTPNPVVLNGSATASPNATDNLSGVDSSSCDPVDTSAVGAQSVSCTATDNAGNTATANAWYSVVFNFQGFFQPVDNGGVYNVVQAGRAIPVKFSLGGNQGLNILASGYPKSTVVACSGAAGTDVLEETLTSGSSSLQYDGTVNPPVGQYIYVWKTEKSWASTCRRLDVKLADGSTRTAFFSFKK